MAVGGTDRSPESRIAGRQNEVVAQEMRHGFVVYARCFMGVSSRHCALNCHFFQGFEVPSSKSYQSDASLVVSHISVSADPENGA